MKSLTYFLFSTALFAQQPIVDNARLDTRPYTGSLSAMLGQFGGGPWWAGYAEPMIPGRHGDMCDGRSNGTVRLEGPTTLVILVRMETGKVDQLKVVSIDCRLDGGGLPFHWITNVPPAESVNWLKSQVIVERPDRALSAIALHAGPASDQALDDFTAANQPARIREKAAFWLGVTRGLKGVEKLRQLLASDPDDKFRSKVIFALSQSSDQSGMAAVIEAARNDRSPYVRGQALFWMAQKAGKSQADAIRNAARDDPDRSVKERAVFALSQLPADEAVPRLIDVAKSNSDPEVRKKAMFWLGQSKDQRAVEFFAQVLKQ